MTVGRHLSARLAGNLAEFWLPPWQAAGHGRGTYPKRPAVPGCLYAYAARADQAALVCTAGACPLDEHGNVVAPGDVRAQMRQALSNLATALEDSGSAIRAVLKTTVYVASSSRDDLLAAWDEVATVFSGHDVPSTLLGVTVLGYPGQPVEIEAIALATSRPPRVAYAA